MLSVDCRSLVDRSGLPNDVAPDRPCRTEHLAIFLVQFDIPASFSKLNRGPQHRHSEHTCEVAVRRHHHPGRPASGALISCTSRSARPN